MAHHDVRQKKMQKLLILSLASAVAGGCASNTHIVKNIGKHDLYAVNVASQGKEHGHGMRAPGTFSVYSGRLEIDKDVPFTVSWKNSINGTIFTKTLTLREFPMGRDVVLYLDGTDVTPRIEAKP